ncbi:hypothetical protein N657DRAFT_244229 [Parathielavia appendiculata]|uniref:Uncharacterized protein n=1 Tax=Parathielavia appendiculata TaxID=2587402 RepID=A0AAN6YZZ8_9PEZI|nr:hypothetical protein N657DRAFT_244229 [Parathielavia appendiculata]
MRGARMLILIPPSGPTRTTTVSNQASTRDRGRRLFLMITVRQPVSPSALRSLPSFSSSTFTTLPLVSPCCILFFSPSLVFTVFQHFSNRRRSHPAAHPPSRASLRRSRPETFQIRLLCRLQLLLMTAVF